MSESLSFDLDDEEKEVFCLEAEEQIGLLDANLLALEQGQQGPEVVQVLFRAAHTLKGSAGAIGHQRMASLTHAMEALLELLRQSRLAVTPELIDLLLRSVDALRALSQEVSTGEHSGVEPSDLVARLQAFAAGNDAKTATPGTDDAMYQPSDQTLEAADRAPSDEVAEHPGPLSERVRQVRVSARIASDSIAPAARALQVLLALQDCGKVLSSDPDRAAIERQDATERIDVCVETGWTSQHIEEHLKYIGELRQLSVTSEREADAHEGGTGKGVAGASTRTNGNLKTVRTSVERLDKLMNLVGELVTDRNRLLQAQTMLSSRYGDGEFAGELAQAIVHLASITDELQEEVMRARMLPLEHAFNKFPRLVRDLARELDKDVVLQIEGQETELDRSVIEEIGDPLLHLLRNAVDHGIESPDERRAAGKPARGVIRMSGRSEGNHIVITIADDGRGIDAESVKASAVQRGLIAEEVAAYMTDVDAFELIFSPGLSTAKKVSDISGRGVGMDVVRTNIERLHGSVSVRSQLGSGTTFELSLPLTLAIMPVLLVGLNGYTYCIPLSTVTEVIVIKPDTIHAVERGEVILWRKRLLPLVRLRQFYGQPEIPPSAGQRLPTVVVRWGEEYVGLVVDKLHGQQEIVIKSLGHLIGQVSGLSGSAILGDGSVALIVDVPGLIKRATRSNAELSARLLAA